MNRTYVWTLLLCLLPAVTFAASLEERVAALEEALAEAPESGENPFALELHGIVEVEAVYESLDPEGGGRENASDLVLATAALDAEARVDEHYGARLILLYEEEEDATVKVDEATIDARFDAATLRLGRHYLPFSAFPTAMVSDPLTQGLGEIRETALTATGELGIARASASLFKGDAAKEGKEHVDDFVLSVEVVPSEFLAFGAGYIADLADTDWEPMTLYTRKVGGWSAFATATAGRFGLSAEVVGAAGRFAAVDLDADGDGEGDRPLAWNAELSVSPVERWLAAVRAAGSQEMAGVPESQWGATLAFAAAESVTVALEYLHDRYDSGFGDGLDSADRFTLHVGLA